jgi:ABC-type cobalamin/Fe3+-siderophores transport system ATPase subunit
MIERSRWLADIAAALRRSRVTALLGPRQAGKTTLARQIVPQDSPAYFDLEDPTSLARLDEPMTALGALRGTVVIDETQRRPDLLRQASESLAGRLETIRQERPVSDRVTAVPLAELASAGAAAVMAPGMSGRRRLPAR